MVSDFNKKLDIMIPDARCELNYNRDYELLIATVLSAQCTDKRVNEVTSVLFSNYDIYGLSKAKKSEAIEKKSLLSQLRDFGFGPVIGVIISMLTVPVTTRILSPEEYGKASLFVLFESIFLIVGTLGLDQGYVRFYNQGQIDRQSLFQNPLFLIIKHLEELY